MVTHSLTLWITLLSVLVSALANTEIINFSTSKEPIAKLPFTRKWPVLGPNQRSIQLNATSAPLGSVLPQTLCPRLNKWHPGRQHLCPHELWLVLDLDADEWKSFDKFTLRLSWPAFHPTDFFINVFDPKSLDAFKEQDNVTSSTTTRRRYARIQMVHTGVLTPGANALDEVSRRMVSVHLIVEPLHFGALPSSVIPVVFALIIVILVGLPIAAYTNRYFQGIVKEVKALKGPRAKMS